MAKKSSVAVEDTDVEIGEVITDDKPVAKAAKPARQHGHAESEFELVEIELPVEIVVNGKALAPGKHKVERHQARDILHMAASKMRADLQALSVTSKSYLVNRALTGAINVKEVSEIKFK